MPNLTRDILFYAAAVLGWAALAAAMVLAAIPGSLRRTMVGAWNTLRQIGRFGRATRPRLWIPALLAASFLAACTAPPTAGQTTNEWPAYGREAGGTRHSPLRQITPSNVGELEVAWVYRTGDYHPGTRFEATPLFVDGLVYVSTPLGRVSALDPVTGEERWTFDPRISLRATVGDFANRGVAYWRDPADLAATCGRRIFVAPIDARLIALDARTGRPCETFGNHGIVRLVEGLRHPPEYEGEYWITSPPAVAGDLVIVGSSVADNQRVDAPSGVVRAYDVRTGALAWSWDPIPQSDSAFAREDWGEVPRSGAANVWAPISVDTARDLVFLPVSSPSPDYYGGARPGNNRYANSVVALRASTGEIVWHYQVSHHDLWDYDVPAQPVLFTLRREGGAVPAVVQATKMGHVFVLHRETGLPLFPVEERPVPSSDVPGERASPTQPFPTRPEALTGPHPSMDRAFGLDADRRAACRTRLAGLRNDGIFTPPSRQGSLVYPGNIGGFHWGGLAVDEPRGIAVGPTNRLAYAITLVPGESIGPTGGGRLRELAPQRGAPFGLLREPLVGPDLVPCTEPPWGTLAALDLRTGGIRWEVPLGYLPALAERTPAARGWGALNFGGALLTASGLAFVAAAVDPHLRAFDVETGRELWSATLPAGGQATPMTYMAGGRQYVVIAAGGHDALALVGTPMGDHLVAFTLPGQSVPTPPRVRVQGQYEGDFRVGDRRFYVGVNLAARADGTLAGTLTSPELAIDGPIEGRWRTHAVAFTLSVRVRAEECLAEIVADGERANHGRLIVGDLDVSGTCGPPGAKGTFGLRRRAEGEPDRGELLGGGTP